jgi:hypothetical protein
MFEAFANVQVKDMTRKIKDSLAALSKMDVLVGVPEEKSSREGSITNAELVFIHTHGVRQGSMIEEMQPTVNREGYSKAFQMYLTEHGSPLLQTPPRPIIEPAIEKPKNKQILGEELGKAVGKALDGDVSGAKNQLEITGMTAQNIVRGWWDDPENNWPPNAAATIKQKGSDRPLIDTGELRKSITYVVRDGND